MRFPLLSHQGSLAFCRERIIPGVRDIPHCLLGKSILSFPHLTLLGWMYPLLVSRELKEGFPALL